MASERRSGAGSLASGVLEKLAPPKPSPSEGDAEDRGEGSESIESGRGRGAAREPARKPRADAGRVAKKNVKGRTIYLPEDLFERIMVQAHRRGRTISEYVAGILERQVPDYRTVRAEAAETDAA